jgi:hypothetical protein
LAPGPRLGAAIGAWGASAQSARASGPDEPAMLGKRAPRVGATAAAADATLPAAWTARGTGWRSSELKSSPCPEMLRMRLNGWRICAHCETFSAGQGGGGGGQGGRAQPMRRDGPSASMRGQAQWMWPCLLLGQWDICCKSGGRLGQRLNAADAAWAVAGWGRSSHCFITKAK